MFVSKRDKSSKYEESDESSENELDKKYVALQNNHRRLLGVTTALTEALENTVRGNQYDLEEMLNQCMDIYPELFSLQHKRINSRLTNIERLYTTPASDFTDYGDSNHDVLKNDKMHRKSYGKFSTSARFIENETESSEKYKIGRKPLGFQEYLHDSSNISDTTPYLILTPDNRRNSISSQKSDFDHTKSFHTKENRSSNRRMSHNLEDFVDESNYIVKHPESDSEYRKEDNFKKLNETKNNNVIPYEIIVQQNIQTNQSVRRPDEDFLIKIKPDSAENNNYMKNIPESSQTIQNMMMNTPKKTIITNPLETCIIITNHMNSEVNRLGGNAHGSDFEQNNGRALQTVSENENDALQSHVIQDKLQKLSTGLKVQTNVMQIEPVTTKKTMSYRENDELMLNDSKDFTVSESMQKIDIYGISYENKSTKSYYEKLKSDMTTGSVKDCASILQTLRLKLIHTLAKERADLISSYIENDILNLNKDSTLLEQLLPREIINGWDLILQQIILKFLNTVSSIWKGRDYLTSNIKVITCLYDYFFEKHKTRILTDALSVDMLIAIFHKLSTRPSQQAVLLNTGLLEKIFYNVSEGHETMSTYRLRHSLGVLINLCVHDNGRSLLEPVSSEMLNMLVSLLKKKDKKVTPFVARLIYVLMANEMFHKKAKEVGLLKNLEETINPANKRMKLQLDVLTVVIDQPQPHQFLNGTEDNFLANIEAEMDELEEEVEADEPFLWNEKSENGKIKNALEESPIKTKYKGQNNTNNNKRTSIPIKHNVVKKSENVTKHANRLPQSKIAVKKKQPKLVKAEVIEKPIRKDKSELFHSQNKVSNAKIDTPITTRNETKQQQHNKLYINRNIHEIVESFDEMPTSYIVLNDPSNSIDETQNMINLPYVDKTNMASVIQQDVMSTKEKGFDIIDDNTIVDDKANANVDNTTSFVLLSENESNKSTSSDLNLGLSSENSDSPERNNSVPEEEIESVIKSNEADEKPPSTNNYLMVHSSGSPKVSLFIQQGKITAIDYDYCEDTKEIQSPIERDNIFKENRQSPYQGLLTERKKRFKSHPTVISRMKASSTNVDEVKTDDVIHPQENVKKPPSPSPEIQI